LFILLLDQAISAWMIFKKQAVQLFTLLSCNSPQLFKKNIGKPMLGFFRGLILLVPSLRTEGIYSLPALRLETTEAAHRHQTVRHNTNGQWAMSSR